MSHGQLNPFEPLEPPRGGLAGLRARIEREGARRTRTRRLWAVAATACLLVVVAGAILSTTVDRQQPMPERFRWARVMAGLEPPPAEPLTIAPGQSHLIAARRIPAASEDVVFYFVASVERPPAENP